MFAAQAPSNIALVKYMGKTDPVRNLPENPSLSMTLQALCTVAELRKQPTGKGVLWVSEAPWADFQVPAGFRLEVPALSEQGSLKIVKHVERTHEEARRIFPRYGLNLAPTLAEAGWTLRTANTFPAGSGIASSASSFAAVTLASAAAAAQDPAAFERAWSDPVFRREWAAVARQGSGSATRSMEGPFVLWEREATRTVSSRLPTLAHFVVVVSESEKAVSSSEAHRRVKSSPLWAGRVSRANSRAVLMEDAIGRGDLVTVSREAWREAWEMHSLFHTAETPFTYFKPPTLAVLEGIQPFIPAAGAPAPRELPPIVTLDAGPNVHVTVDEASAGVWEYRLRALVSGGSSRVLRDRPGMGAQLLKSAGGL